MADIDVTLQNGERHRYEGVPDNITPEQVLMQVQKDVPGAQVREIERIPTGLEYVGKRAKEFGVDAVAGFGRGAAGAAKGAGMMADTYTLGTDQKGKELPIGQGTEFSRFLTGLGDDAESFYDRLQNRSGSPKGNIAGGVASGVGGALAGGAITPGGLISGGGAGGGSEVAASAFGEGVLPRLIGGLVGGMVGAKGTSMVAGRAPNAEALAREAMLRIKPEQLEAAAQFQAAQRAKGVEMDLAQALEAVGAPNENITAIRNFLTRRAQGEQTQGVLQRQPGQLGLEADQAAARLGGEVLPMTTAANDLQEAATGAVNDVKRQRSGAVRALYDQAGALPEGSRQQLQSIVRAYLKQDGLTDDVKRAANTILMKLEGNDPKLLAELEGLRDPAKQLSPKMRGPMEEKLRQQIAEAKARPLSAKDVDTWLRELVGPFKGTPMNPADPQAQGQVQKLRKVLGEAFDNMSPETKQAAQRYASLSESLVNPVKQGPTGMMATPRGYRPDLQATLGKFEGLMARGTDVRATGSDIRTLGTQLARTDGGKEAFANAFQTYLSNRIRGAMEATGDAKTTANNGNMAARLEAALWPSELQAQGLRDAVSVIAKNSGVPEADAVRGLNQLMTLVKGMKNRPAGGGIESQEIVKIGGRHIGADALRTVGWTPFGKAAERIEDAVMGNTLRQFDQILTSPEGARLLAQLGRESIMTGKFATALGTFGQQNQSINSDRDAR